MNTKVNKAYFLIPVFYIAVIIFLLYMQFSGSSSFNAEVAGISISGKTHSGAPGREDSIPELNIETNDLLFTFGEKNPLLLFTQDGLVHKTMPVDYRVTASGIDLKLSKDVSVSFFHKQNNDNLLNISVSAGDPESIKYIQLPISGNNIEINTMPGVPVLSIKTETLGNFFLTMPESASFIPESGTIRLYPHAGSILELTLEQTAGSGIDAFTYWISGNKEVITVSELKNTIDKYIENAESALLGSRFNPTRGSWTSGDGTSEFSEEALIMTAAEQINSTSYTRTKELLERAALTHSRELSIRTASLFGNIVNEGWSYDQNLDGKVNSLSKMAEASDYAVFMDPDLTAAVLTEDSEKLIEALASLTEASIPAETDLNQAAAMLKFYSEIDSQAPVIGKRFSGLISVIENNIFPKVKVLSDKLFIVLDENKADIYNSVKIGMLLTQLENETISEDYKAIGRELVNSALQLADESGFLPETVTDSGDGVLAPSGNINPEAIYQSLTDNPYYPSEDFFLQETGDKLSVINQAKDFKVQKTDFGYRMTFDFPANQTHMFAVRNLKPFDMMHLLGYKWNPDHRFLTYSSGWWYDKQHNTLFVKIKHRKEAEEILIYTDTPVEPAAQTDTLKTESSDTRLAGN